MFALISMTVKVTDKVEVYYVERGRSKLRGQAGCELLVQPTASPIL